MANESFTDITEGFLKEIVKEVRTTADCDIKTKVEVLRELTRWVQIKNKIDPSGGEGSKIDEYRNALKTGNPGTGSGNSRRVGRRGGKEARSQIDRLEAVQNGPQIPQNGGTRHTGTSGQDAGRIQGDGLNTVNPPHAINVFKRVDSDDSIVTAIDGHHKNRGFGGL